MTATQPMHLVFCVDDNFCLPLGVLLQSLFETNSKAMHFHVIGSGLSQANLSRLQSLQSPSRAFSFYNVQADDLQNVRISEAFAGRLSIATYYRFLIDSMLPESISRVLYLDADMLVTDNIDELYASNLSGNVAAVVEDAKLSQSQHSQLISMAGQQYFNAGMMLIDLNEWRQRDISATCFDMLASGHDWPYNDQDILNVALEGSVRYVSSTWNLQSHGITGHPSAHIVHFTGAEKPWFFSSSHAYTEQYRGVLSRSVFGEFPLSHNLDDFDYQVVKKLNAQVADVSDIWIYGAGTRGRRLYHYINQNSPRVSVLGFIDKNVVGETQGLTIVNNAKNAQNGHILIGSAAFYDEIRAELERAGVSTDRIV